MRHNPDPPAGAKPPPPPNPPHRPCKFCGEPHDRGGEFCSDRHRAQHYREHCPPGRVASVRSLKNGRASIVMHFSEHEADVVLARFRVGQTAFVAEESDSGT